MADPQLPPERDGRPGRRPRVVPPGTVSIRCRLDGPLVVELAPDLIAQGVALRVTDHEGKPIPVAVEDKPGLALCRCGHSRRRPLCDGSHVACGFRSDQRGPAGP